MKKTKIAFETKFWSAYEIGNPFEVIDAFYDYAHLDYYKQRLAEMVQYSHKKEVYSKEYPGQVFVFYATLRSFLRSCSAMQYKGKKWQVKQAADCKSILHQASLTSEEYADPFKVFQNAFAEKSLEEFEFFLCEIIHIALSPSVVAFDYDLITPYIHLIKMLDASQLMHERGLEKSKDKEHPGG